MLLDIEAANNLAYEADSLADRVLDGLISKLRAFHRQQSVACYDLTPALLQARMEMRKMQFTKLPTTSEPSFVIRRPLTSWKPWFDDYQRTSSVLSGGHTSLES